MSKADQKIKSPCVGLCTTSTGDWVCKGCLRTSEEIVRWNSLSEFDKQSVQKDVINSVFDEHGLEILTKVVEESPVDLRQIMLWRKEIMTKSSAQTSSKSATNAKKD